MHGKMAYTKSILSHNNLANAGTVMCMLGAKYPVGKSRLQSCHAKDVMMHFLLQAQKEAAEAAYQAAATEESRQKALGMGKPMYARSLKPLTEPKDVEFHTAKRQRMQGKHTQEQVLIPSCILYKVHEKGSGHEIWQTTNNFLPAVVNTWTCKGALEPDRANMQHM